MVQQPSKVSLARRFGLARDGPAGTCRARPLSVPDQRLWAHVNGVTQRDVGPEVLIVSQLLGRGADQVARVDDDLAPDHHTAVTRRLLVSLFQEFESQVGGAM